MSWDPHVGKSREQIDLGITKKVIVSERVKCKVGDK